MFSKKKIVDIDTIIAGCKQGDRRAMEQMYKEFYGYAMSISLRYTYSQDDAKDLVNDSFVKVYKKIGLYKGEPAFKYWLRRLIINTAIDAYRKQKKIVQEGLEVVENEPDTYDVDGLEQLNINDILSLFDQLPEIYRVTFNLYEVEGFSHEEIAKMLSIKVSTSRSNLTRAKQKIRNLYHQVNVESYEEKLG